MLLEWGTIGTFMQTDIIDLCVAFFGRQSIFGKMFNIVVDSFKQIRDAIGSKNPLLSLTRLSEIQVKMK